MDQISFVRFNSNVNRKVLRSVSTLCPNIVNMISTSNKDFMSEDKSYIKIPSS